MKPIYILILCMSVLSVSCIDDESLEFDVDKPISVAEQEKIDAYDALKTYVNKERNPKFILGAGVSLDEYNKKGLMYRLVNANFEEIAIGYAMKHGAVVQEDGSLALNNVETLLLNAKESGLTVYGHTLCWHANQNAEYLNSTIAPEVIPPSGGPEWIEITGADFETDDASNYESNANAPMTIETDGDRRVLKITNAEDRANDWDSQFFVTFSPAMEVGEVYELSMDVRADMEVTFGTQAHVVPYQYKHWDFFGSITANTEWNTFSKQITITESTATTGAIAFNLGKTAANYYFDNISLKKYNENGSGPSLDPSVITNTDFESGDAGWGGWGNSSTRALSADGEGYGGTGYAYTFTNPALANYWSAQIAYSFPALEMDATYQLNFQVKASTSGTIRAELQSPDYSNDGFGTFAISDEWKEYTLVVTITKEDRERLVISYGDFEGTVYIDNVTLRRENPDGNGEQIIEKTPAEKKEIITAELERWIAGMMEVTKDYVTAWDAVNEPMDDGDPYELKTGIGKTDLPGDHFYWQDYLGKDYAVTVFKLARKYGNEGDLLFVNDYNLEYNLDKCRGLIEYVAYMEAQGAVVDGIGSQMHIGINSDKEQIAEMFKLLAATGKLVKVSELDVRVNTTEVTAEILQQQSDMYKYVVDMYNEHVPTDQQYGISVWGLLDSTEDSFWLPGEKQGLWNRSYDRKPAYAGFAEGLKGL